MTTKNTIVIENETYKLPEWVIKRNSCLSEDKQWKIQNTLKGSTDCQNHDDFRESECFEVYIDHFEISQKIISMPTLESDVMNSMFAWVTDAHNEEYTMVLLIKQ